MRTRSHYTPTLEKFAKPKGFHPRISSSRTQRHSTSRHPRVCPSLTHGRPRGSSPRFIRCTAGADCPPLLPKDFYTLRGSTTSHPPESPFHSRWGINDFVDRFQRRGITTSRLSPRRVPQSQEPLLYYVDQPQLPCNTKVHATERTEWEPPLVCLLGRGRGDRSFLVYRRPPSSLFPQPAYSLRNPEAICLKVQTFPSNKSRRLSGFSGPLLCEQSSKAHLDQMPHPPFHSHLEPRRKLVQTHVVSERVLYNESPYHFFNEHLVNMAKNRASRGAKLSSISIVGLGGSVPGREMLKLRGHVVYLECRSDDAPPDWDSVPGESSGEGQ